jgi:hypothetical protein
MNTQLETAINLLLRDQWHYQGKRVSDVVQSSQLTSQYRNAVFISDTTLMILAEILTVQEDPDSSKSLIGLPTLVRYNVVSHRVESVAPIDFVLDSVTPLCQFLFYDKNVNQLLVGTTSPTVQTSSTLEKVTVPTVTRISLDGQRYADYLPLPPEHNYPGLRFSIYTMSFASDIRSGSFAAFNTIPRVYNISTGKSFEIHTTPTDNSEFFSRIHGGFEQSQLGKLIHLFRLDIKQIAIGYGDTMFVSMWYRSTDDDSNRWMVQKYSTEGKFYQAAMVPSSEENRVRYVGYSPEAKGVIVVRMSMDEKWRLSLGNF